MPSFWRSTVKLAVTYLAAISFFVVAAVLFLATGPHSPRTRAFSIVLTVASFEAGRAILRSRERRSAERHSLFPVHPVSIVWHVGQIDTADAAAGTGSAAGVWLQAYAPQHVTVAVQGIGVGAHLGASTGAGEVVLLRINDSPQTVTSDVKVFSFGVKSLVAA
jgi:hypothetical protein